MLEDSQPLPGSTDPIVNVNESTANRIPADIPHAASIGSVAVAGEAAPRELFGAENLHVNPGARWGPFRARIRDRIKGLARPTVRYDRFGNRLYTSPDKAYLDRQGVEAQASLLVSQEGQVWMRRNPGILRDLNQGLVALNREASPGTDPPTEVNIGEGRRLAGMAHQPGNNPKQSKVYVLDTPEGKYIVKHANPDSLKTQPYLNEMLQMQELSHAMHDELEAAGVELTTFLFATSEVSCTKFVEGSRPDDGFPDLGATQRLKAQIMDYVVGQRRRRGSSLWEGVFIDMNLNNFITRPDGKIVCIDLFNFKEQLRPTKAG